MEGTDRETRRTIGHVMVGVLSALGKEIKAAGSMVEGVILER